MRKYKDLNNTAYPRVPSANTVKLSTGAKNNLKYNAPGMPIGGIAIIYDKYHQIFDNGTYKSKAVGTYVVGEDGILRLTNLRDSVYSIQFQNIEHVLYNISELHVGNPDLY
ncbi:MAG: hypothetical protein KDH96_11885, partial [Candidatus Riesia sp.]|nr:hypothetical protein [Candidatus Riesia sp.]